jgi:hypothetical protein
MPAPLYLVAILASFAGMVIIDRRWRLGAFGRPLLVAIVVVEVAFLAFDVVGAWRGWFATETTTVIAYVPPGIPPEEPLLLAFLTTFSVVVWRIAGRLTGEGAADA